MTSNAKGRNGLCLDLFKCVNQVIKAPKFRIKLTLAALQVIESNDYLFSFDLKSAYLQVNVNENFLQYFGFGFEYDDGSRRFF